MRLDYLVKCSNEFSFDKNQKLYLYELIAKASKYVKDLKEDLRNSAAEFILTSQTFYFNLLK